ncbi:uncharacterized protein [Dysidea avara]|uniref:uncharacterized protein n=1 Tax=Dysidea avara TaxID=196820 RepID=UPI0033348A28
MAGMAEEKAQDKQSSDDWIKDEGDFFPVTLSYCSEEYYPIGNTPPDDLLQSITTVTQRPDVLLLGCGDLQSCLYTLWNNFDPRHTRNFKGVHFMLNDINAAVLARNILFLYLCVQMPASHGDKVKWVTSFWAIWYCHELLPDHKRVLIHALSQLLKWSDSTKSWSESADNPLKSLVKFYSPTSLSQICQVWKTWCKSRYTSTLTEMRAERSKRCEYIITDFFHHPTHQLFSYFGGILLKNISKHERIVLKDEIVSYRENGFVFAEEVLGIDFDAQTRLVNSTFIDRSDGKYRITHDLIPYRNFFFAYQLSPNKLRGYSDIPLMVEDGRFTDKPLLANSVQQFSIWMKSCAEILQSEILQSDHDIVFTFQCSDALVFCQRLHNNPSWSCFDAIYSSNLLDFVAPPSLILLALQILKPDGVLFTNIVYHTSESNTFGEYVRRAFGVECKHLQLLCGVRCVGYEDEFSNIVSIEPVPHSYGIDSAVVGVRVKSLMWQHVIATPLTNPKKEHLDFMWKTLSSSIVRYLSNDQVIFNHASTGSVVILLQAFASQLTNDCSTFQFWKQLCCLLLMENSLQKFHTSLQTQSWLHGVHLHLTLSDLNCPMCKNQNITDAIVQQIITVSADELSNKTDCFIVTANNHNSTDNLHFIDDVAISTNDNNVHAHFFVPVVFAQENYRMALWFNNVSLGGHKNEVAPKNYFFNNSIQKPPCQQSPSVLGTVIQHSGDDHQFETVITLNDLASSALNNHQLTIQQCNGRTISIVIGNYYTNISYPYTIDYGKQLSVKLSRKNKEVIITAHRTRCSLQEEPVFIVNPDNMLSFPVMLLSIADAKSFSDLSLWCDPCLPVPDTAEYHLKETIAVLLQSTTENFFSLVCDGDGEPETKFLIAVLNRVFDCRNKTPAIDVLFWHCSDQDHSVMLHWGNQIKFTNTATYQMAIKVFDYFKSCTVSTVPEENTTYQYLVKQKVKHLFTNRAVIYPLYPNGDEKIADQTACNAIVTFLNDNTEKHAFHQRPYWFKKFKANIHENRCSNCHRDSTNLNRSSCCRLVQYCSVQCQKQHWKKTHKRYCTPFPE